MVIPGSSYYLNSKYCDAKYITYVTLKSILSRFAYVSPIRRQNSSRVVTGLFRYREKYLLSVNIAIVSAFDPKPQFKLIYAVSDVKSCQHMTVSSSTLRHIRLNRISYMSRKTCMPTNAGRGISVAIMTKTRTYTWKI